MPRLQGTHGFIEGIVIGAVFVEQISAAQIDPLGVIQNVIYPIATDEGIRLGSTTLDITE